MEIIVGSLIAATLGVVVQLSALVWGRVQATPRVRKH
jgi:hypothetical protein